MDAIKTGDFIRELRKGMNMTQQQFAEELHVSDKAVSRWETGRGMPDIGNMEDIANTCGVTVAELLKGEKLTGNVTEEDVKEASAVSFTMAKEFVNRKKWLDLAAGFLIGAIILLLAVVRLSSPAPVTGGRELISVEKLSGNVLVAVMDDGLAGYEVSRVTDPESGLDYVFISGYETVWNTMAGSRETILVPLGREDSVDYVFYYPGEDGDIPIWKNDAAPEMSEGVETLPRLVYNFWIIAFAVLGITGLVFCFVNRKKYYFPTALRITMVPVALAISMLAVLAGSFGVVYGAPYYLSGILLLSVLLYLLFIIIYTLYGHKRKI